MTCAPRSTSRAASVDLPEPIPPVRPTTNIFPLPIQADPTGARPCGRLGLSSLALEVLDYRFDGLLVAGVVRVKGLGATFGPFGYDLWLLFGNDRVDGLPRSRAGLGFLLEETLFEIALVVLGSGDALAALGRCVRSHGGDGFGFLPLFGRRGFACVFGTGYRLGSEGFVDDLGGGLGRRYH